MAFPGPTFGRWLEDSFIAPILISTGIKYFNLNIDENVLKSLVSKGQWMVVEYKLGTFCFIYLSILF